MDISEIEYPILQTVHDLTQLEFDTVMNLNPDENLIETYLGEEITYDYLVLCNGKIPVLDHINNLRDQLMDRFSFVVSNFDIDSSKKFAERLEYFYGGDIVVYCNGRESRDWYSAINSAFVQKDKFQKHSNVKFIVKDTISGIEEQDLKLYKLLEEKNIEVIKGLEQVSIEEDNKLVFKDFTRNATMIGDNSPVVRDHQDGSNSGTINGTKFSENTEIDIIDPDFDPKLMNYDFLYVQPNYRMPSILKDIPELNLDSFDKQTMQNLNYKNIFATGNLLHIGSGIDAILEQAFVCVTNLNTQAKLDLGVLKSTDFEYQNRLCYKGHEKHYIYPEAKKCIEINFDGQKLLESSQNSLSQRFKYHSVAYIHFQDYMYRMKKGFWFGRHGYKPPKVNSENTNLSFKKV